MFQVIRKQTRSSTATPFFQVKGSESSPSSLPESVLNYIVETYVFTGKLLNSDSSVSSDGLELTINVFWNTEEDHNIFKNDSFIVENFINVEEQYLANNGITLQVTTQQV